MVAECEEQRHILCTYPRSATRGGYRISPRGGRSVMDWCLNSVARSSDAHTSEENDQNL